MSKEVKFSKEEVDNIQKIRDGYDELVVKLGQIEMSIINLQSNKNSLIKESESLKIEENEIIKSMTEKYGDGQLDVNTGVFIPE
tara:strand:- start:54593 stop:54844 length:252 start_codon:yes stop_codon:yes gene_type:complete